MSEKFNENLFNPEEDPNIIQQEIEERQEKIESNNKQIALGNSINENLAENAALEQEIADLEEKLRKHESAV